MIEPIEQDDEEIILVKKNGIWKMKHYKNDHVSIGQGKELVISLMDFKNPVATTVIDGEILSKPYNSLLLKHNSDKQYEEHNCFQATEEQIKNILENNGLVLAWSEEFLAEKESVPPSIEE